MTDNEELFELLCREPVRDVEDHKVFVLPPPDWRIAKAAVYEGFMRVIPSPDPLDEKFVMIVELTIAGELALERLKDIQRSS